MSKTFGQFRWTGLHKKSRIINILISLLVVTSILARVLLLDGLLGFGLSVATDLEDKIMTAQTTEQTVKTTLRPIDRDGLAAFAERGRNNPGAGTTNIVHTVCEGQYRTLSYVGKHAAVVVDEPLHLFGEDTAPAPGEIALSALGGCLAVGITAVATWKKIALSRLELHLEGDIGNPAAWGAGGAEKMPSDMGFRAIRVRVDIEGDASREELDEIVARANYYSPVANTMRNPIPFKIELA